MKQMEIDSARRSTPSKTDNLTPEHLGWLVESRASNQRAALTLFKLIEKHPEKNRSKEFLQRTQTLVAACFSLWRAAFLADKTGKRHAVLADAKAFLGKMLTDNAINYPQDRSAREWTFNYYVKNANDCLLELGKEWAKVSAVLSAPRKVVKGTTASSRRWDRHQRALEVAVECFEEALASGRIK
jgi:hypothetical protein